MDGSFIIFQLFSSKFRKLSGQLLYGAGHGFPELFCVLLIQSVEVELQAFCEGSLELAFGIFHIQKKGIGNGLNRGFPRRWEAAATQLACRPSRRAVETTSKEPS